MWIIKKIVNLKTEQYKLLSLNIKKIKNEQSLRNPWDSNAITVSKRGERVQY